MIRILIVDDHPVVAQGIEQILEGEQDIEVGGTAGSVREGMVALEHETYDVVLLDVTLPDGGGIEAMGVIHQQWPTLPVLMLSVHDERSYALRAIRAGARGYLRKDCDAEELINGIRAVAGGESCVSSQVESMIVRQFSLGDGQALPHDCLSDREYEVLGLLAEGHTIISIAEQLSVGRQTVSTYRRRILDKLDLSTNEELARYALAHGLIASFER